MMARIKKGPLFDASIDSSLWLLLPNITSNSTFLKYSFANVTSFTSLSLFQSLQGIFIVQKILFECLPNIQDPP